FRKDKEFHKRLAAHVELKGVDGPDGLPDSFLVAQRWCEKTAAILEKGGEPQEALALPTRLVVESWPAVCQRQYAMAIEEEGQFGEVAVNAWKRALKMWDDFGDREVVSKDGKKVRLKDNEASRVTVNYDYWIKRCQAEQTAPVLAARQASF